MGCFSKGGYIDVFEVKDRSFMYSIVTLPSPTLAYPLKIDSWKTILSFWGFWAYFQGQTCC